MTQSPLVTRTIPHHNKFGSRDGRSVDRVIQHHWAGPGGDARLANPTQQASSTYLIFSDGTIAIQVPEEYRPWTSGSYEADVNSITIEVENDAYQKHGNDNHPDSWSISNAAYNSIVALLADIARRYGWGIVTDDRYRGHREFSSTACPGGYLWARMADTRKRANAALGGAASFAPAGTITTPASTTSEEDFLMALSDKQQKDIYWILCTEDGRAFLAELVGKPIKATVFSKQDGAYQNRILEQDIAPTLGRIETAVGATLTKDDGHSLRLAIQAVSGSNPETIAKAVIGAIGEDLAGDVVAELGKALSKESK